MLNTFARLCKNVAKLCNNVEYINYCELLSYCYMHLLYITVA